MYEKRFAPSLPIIPLSLSLSLALGCTSSTNNGEVPGSVSDKLIGSGPFGLHGVPTANPKAPGLTTPDLLPPELMHAEAVRGSFAVENPATVTRADGTTATVT